VGIDLAGHTRVGVACELLGDALVHALFGEHGHVRVAHVVDPTVVDACLVQDRRGTT
jgi:hypothetical protein